MSPGTVEDFSCVGVGFESCECEPEFYRVRYVLDGESEEDTGIVFVFEFDCGLP